jgi:Domain of unknown function (DUF3846)
MKKIKIEDNKNYLIIINLDGTIEITELTSQPTLEQLQKGAGGHIEVVPYFNTFAERKCIAFCNEEGKLHGYQYNIHAQKLWEKAYGKEITVDYLVGPIVVIVGSESFLAQL